ncbi:histone H4 transcription factor-like isoform X2 [Terrapene carolina triunguis]|uniref:histone H4 transcription factor-like isoform X2 n=1 Tax=Terrapene triunguis TaxID=2587831 RepID=UPI000E77768F|nr:histone H4 transcription factor-like isoform X2 [Terrapene carolina triunguis]
MAPGNKFKNSELILLCEWEECLFVGKCMEEFCDHIAEHLKEYRQHPLERTEQYHCWWRNCEFLATGPRELVTHVNFHSYHTKLKFLGSQLRASHQDWPACSQNSHNQNQIPRISEMYVCQWENCDVTYNNPEWFYRHVAMHAYSTKKENISSNKKAICCCHWKEQVFVCQNCDKHFANERLLRDYMRGHVTHVTCPFCDTVCTSVSSLKAHIRFRHCDERPFHCDLCESSFKNAYDLHKHVETHDSNAYSCDVEGCVFTSRTSQILRQHYKRAHMNNGNLKYKCHICQKCYSWCYTLTLHLRKAHKLSCHSRFRYKEDDDGYLRLNLAVYNGVMGLDQGLENKMAPKKSSVVQNSTGKDSYASCKRSHSSVELHTTRCQRWSQTTAEKVMVESETSIMEPMYFELQTTPQSFENSASPSELDEAMTLNTKEKLIEIAMGLGIQVAV